MAQALEKTTSKNYKMLEEFDIFKNFSKQKLSRLVPAMLTVKYKRNIPVFKQGDPIDGLYMIKSGDFELK